MGLIHNALSRGPWTAAIKAILGDTRSEGGVERYGETFTPVLDPWSQPDFAYARGEWLWSVSLTQAAVPAEGAMAAILDPLLNNRIIVTIDGIQVATTASQSFFLGLSTEGALKATLALAGNPRTRDTRWGKGLQPASAYGFAPVESYAGSDPTVSFNTALEKMTTSAGITSRFNTLPYILSPGNALWVQSITVNIGFDFVAWGRARQALPGEL